MSYYVYLLRCSDDSYYCGYTTDLEKRVFEHNNSEKGAKYTRAKRPVILHYYEKVKTKSEALKREYMLRNLSHKEKQLLK